MKKIEMAGTHSKVLRKHSVSIPSKKKKSPSKTRSLQKLKSSKHYKKFKISCLVILIAVVGLVIYNVTDIMKYINDSGLIVTPQTIANSILGADIQFRKDDYGYTNFLLVGIDTRENGDGLNTDTIMVISYNYDTNTLNMVSIPRDTVLAHTAPDKEGYYVRVNSMYMIAEEATEDSGLPYLQDVVSNYLGLEIHYAALINLKGFEEIIDSIGGVDVYIENTFTDTSYPTDNGKTKVIKFTAGWEHMDGARSLEYARSRHGQWPEGTDFARNKRQQKLITAIGDKIKSDTSLTNVSKIKNILESITSNIQLLNISNVELESVANLIKGKGVPDSQGIVLDPSIGNWNLLEEGGISFGTNPQFAITPKPEYWNYDIIQLFIRDFLNSPTVVTENATIVIYNNSDQYYDTYTVYSNLINNFPYWTINWGNNYPLEEETSTDIYICNTDKPETAEELQDYFESLGYSVKMVQDIDPKYEEDISITVQNSTVDANE